MSPYPSTVASHTVVSSENKPTVYYLYIFDNNINEPPYPLETPMMRCEMQSITQSITSRNDALCPSTNGECAQLNQSNKQKKQNKTKTSVTKHVYCACYRHYRNRNRYRVRIF